MSLWNARSVLTKLTAFILGYAVQTTFLLYNFLKTKGHCYRILNIWWKSTVHNTACILAWWKCSTCYSKSVKRESLHRMHQIWVHKHTVIPLQKYYTGKPPYSWQICPWDGCKYSHGLWQIQNVHVMWMI